MMRDVCPVCDRHSAHTKIARQKCAAYDTQWRCCACNAASRMCEWKYYTPAERERVNKRKRQRKNELNRKRRAEGKDDYYQRNRDTILAKQRQRYRTDSDYREQCHQQSAKWYRENKERDDARKKQWIAEHPDMHGQYCKRSKLNKYKREKEKLNESQTDRG